MVGKLHGAPQQLYSALQSAGIRQQFSTGHKCKGLLAKWVFDGSVINLASTGLLHGLKARQTFGKPLIFSK